MYGQFYPLNSSDEGNFRPVQINSIVSWIQFINGSFKVKIKLTYQLSYLVCLNAVPAY